MQKIGEGTKSSVGSLSEKNSLELLSPSTGMMIFSSLWRPVEGAHHVARSLMAKGYHVKLISPKFVKLFVKSNKNDAKDVDVEKG